MDRKTYRITGRSALLMHSTTALDPSHPLSKAKAELTRKHATKKTDEDQIEIQRLEFLAGLYHDDKIGPYLPANMLLAAIRDGGKANKLGAEITRSVFIEEDKVPLQYSGPRTVDKLWSQRFYDVQGVKVGKSMVLRTRPHFTGWSAEFTVSYDADHLDEDQLDFAVRNAGARVGIGDYRPRYGRFDVEQVAV